MCMKLIFYITQKFVSAKLNSKRSQFFFLQNANKSNDCSDLDLEDCHHGMYLHFATKYKISYTSHEWFFLLTLKHMKISYGSHCLTSKL